MANDSDGVLNDLLENERPVGLTEQQSYCFEQAVKTAFISGYAHGKVEHHKAILEKLKLKLAGAKLQLTMVPELGPNSYTAVFAQVVEDILEQLEEV